MPRLFDGAIRSPLATTFTFRKIRKKEDALELLVLVNDLDAMFVVAAAGRLAYGREVTVHDWCKCNAARQAGTNMSLTRDNSSDQKAVAVVKVE